MSKINWELLDRVLGNTSPEEFAGMSMAEIRAILVEHNREWSREGNGLTDEEIGEAAADLYDLNN